MNSPAAAPKAAVPSSERPLFFDLSARVKLRLTGADCFRYLNGQITNDLRKATAMTAIQASLLNAKGKLSAHVFISIEADGAFVLDADPELRDELPARLERYIIADDVAIEDVTEQFALFHFTGAAAPNGGAGTRTAAAERFGLPGSDFWCDRRQSVELQQSFHAEWESCDQGCAETLRIERGIPRWGRELTGEIIPVEANLEASSIDYGKGCYIGQEVISRMKMSGQTNKRLCGLVSLSGVALEPEARLTGEADPAREAGWITSATKSARLEKEIALGYEKRGHNAPGTRLRAGDIPVEVVALPFL